jgi:hypothetical protein
MATNNRAQKLSELPLVSSIGPNDLFYICQSNGTANVSMRATANQLGVSSSLQLIVGPIEGNVKVTSNGTANVVWFTYDSTVYSSAKILFNATDNASFSRSFGEMYVSSFGAGFPFANNVSTVDVEVGTPSIRFANSGNVASNGLVSLWFSRSSTSTTNVYISYQITYFNI